MNKTTRIVILTIVLLTVTVYSSQAYFSYGARATGMGGAFTAMADDGSLVYWNPGSLFLLNGWVIEMQYGSDGVFAEDVREDMDFLRDWVDGSDFDSDLSEKAVSNLWDNDWLVKGGDTISLVIANQYSAFHFTQYQMFYVQPGDDESYEYQMSAIEVKEYGVSAAIMGGSGGFSLGVTGKYIDTDAYVVEEDLWSIPSTDPDELFDYIEDHGRTASDDNWGLDAGIMLSFGTSRVGFTARNIVGYEIEIDDETKIEIEPEYRLGYAYMPSNRFVFSVDYSIDKEKDLFGNDLDGSELAAGFESVFGDKRWLIVRGGVSLPMEGNAPMIFSMGAGLNFQQAILDFGYAMDQDQDSEKLWGGIRFMF